MKLNAPKMKLNAPKQLTWLIAIILGVLGLITLFVPALAFFAAQAFWLVFAGLVLLALGCFLKGL